MTAACQVWIPLLAAQRKLTASGCALTGTVKVCTLDSPPSAFYLYDMAVTATPEVRPSVGQDEQTDSRSDLEPGYLVICWNDPVNLMDYVTHVFQAVFGWNRQKAEHHMLQVHNQGKSVLTRESMEKAEFYVHQLQKYTLHATMERD
jgi:ATP-dependent Clp protease adaptor protein ClpS